MLTKEVEYVGLWQKKKKKNASPLWLAFKTEYAFTCGGVVVHKLEMTTFIYTMCQLTQATEQLKWIWDICIYLRLADVD